MASRPPFFYHNWFYFYGIEKAAEALLCLRRGHSLHQIALDLGDNRVVSNRIIGQVALGER